MLPLADPFAEERMQPVLEYLDKLTAAQTAPEATASVVLLQECTPSDLTTTAFQPWVRNRYRLLDTDHTSWMTTHYETTMLVDVRLSLQAALRVHYSKTRIDRDALFVHVVLGPGDHKVRVCNTHLELMTLEPPYRPLRMTLVASYLPAEGVNAGLAAGDFSAIQLFDRTLHIDGNNKLKDAFLTQVDRNIQRWPILGASRH
ncbi:hypothetical protein GGR57DRAFT_477234 [Xylariaceae sp. FL1272]|nr:hypothetical protein GGR57DRAFT_477234 [Xylariaceae sp. FL1272]